MTDIRNPDEQSQPPEPDGDPHGGDYEYDEAHSEGTGQAVPDALRAEADRRRDLNPPASRST
ncbi:hypothetical protein [Actinoplanes rectilineatus]|uniref:hypothetical protein n=1 Tax=Actinoplanes rectilineatus TaxID=113571 RepID=UPI0005F2A9E5|nr:hypothetical protein [Actinoplanes rectilineatus]